MKTESLLSLFAACTLSLSACVTVRVQEMPNAAAKGNPGNAAVSDEVPIIDAHTHPGFSGEKERTSGILITREQYFAQWKEAGVVGAIGHQSRIASAPSSDLRSENVVSCAGAPERPDFKVIEKGLKDGKFGCIKVYLGYVHQWANDPHYLPLYRLAEKYDVPVVFHTGDTYSTEAKLKFADPLTIDEVAVDFPKVRFVIAHLGNPWIESAAEVAYKNPNVFLEVSALLIGDLSEQPREKVDELVVKPIAWAWAYLEDPKKMIFGTDWPLTRIRPYADAVKRAIPREHWKAVFHDNALKIFTHLKDRSQAASTSAR